MNVNASSGSQYVAGQHGSFNTQNNYYAVSKASCELKNYSIRMQIADCVMVKQRTVNVARLCFTVIL